MGKPRLRQRDGPAPLSQSEGGSPAPRHGSTPREEPNNAILAIDQLGVCFPTATTPLWAAKDVSLQICQGEIAALVGESGSGKSVTALSVLRLVPPPGRIAAGRILFQGRDLLSLSARDISSIRGSEIGWISQTPRASLNPSFTVGDQIADAVARHEEQNDRRAVAERTHALLEPLGFSDPSSVLPRYPHELSGGMCQRVAIAIALAGRPSLLIADEPTTALDVATQAQILALLRRLNKDTGLTILLITHDLALVRALAHRTFVMRRGDLLEAGETSQILRSPAHDYTRALLDAVPKWSPSTASVTSFTAGGPRSIDDSDEVAEPQVDRDEPEVSEGRPLITVRGLTKRYRVKQAGQRRDHVLTAVDGISLQIQQGQTLALVGESGSGKSTVGRMLVGLIGPDEDDIQFDDSAPPVSDIAAHPVSHSVVQIVFQDPLLSLNPRRTIGQTIERPLANAGVPRAERRERVIALLEAVQLDPAVATRYPGEISGGQCQRVAIARSLALRPRFLVLDEPVSALDVSVQAQILALLRQLQRKLNLTYLFITHDLRLVPEMAQDVAVMRRGQIVESGPSLSVLAAPSHPYTKRLRDSVLCLDTAPNWDALAAHSVREGASNPASQTH